jgi:chemotaxis protein CheD
MKRAVGTASAGMPSAVPGFEDIQRSWDSAASRWIAKIAPGEYYVTNHDETIITVLGSCISACIRDPDIGAGGMNHFMLPQEQGGSAASSAAGLATRFGSYAMESLVNSLMKLGANRARFEIKLFGGGRILASGTDVGVRNIEFVRQYLHTEGLRIVAEDLGDNCPRRVEYSPATGKVRLRRLPPLDATGIADRERRYQADIVKRDSGDVELFD